MRNQRRAIAAETVAILGRGGYRHPVAGEVALTAAITRAVAGPRAYPPGAPLPAPDPVAGRPRLEVTAETTLAAARRLPADTVCLVFASATRPGGGFLTGAQAQEESIARASALYACQQAAPEFYDFHRGLTDLRYSDWVIYSPGVPVFRDDDGTLLPRPYARAFVTAAAPNLTAIRASQPETAPTVPGVLCARARRVLQVAAAHGHRRLVLGAWGCGVFGNDPANVATAFHALLQEPGGFGFGHVVFAVHDPEPGQPALALFRELLA
jgi:uncharacterized protein (TIGR02452 family)